jgi:hypothetical protein
MIFWYFPACPGNFRGKEVRILGWPLSATFAAILNMELGCSDDLAFG